MSDPAYPDPATRNVLEHGCARCPALVAARERIAWGNGSPDAAVMVVGEAPGAGDRDADRWRGGNWTGLAYTARHSGRRIRALFERLGYAPDDCYVTNAVKCFPADPADTGTNREPMPTERRACAGHLRTEIDQVDPSVVITTGRHATAALLEPYGLVPDRFVASILDPIDCPALDVTVLPILHPSYQAVWLARLGLDGAVYEDRIRAAIERVR